VTDIPETTFNNMHGKIIDLRTKDAEQFAARQLNEIGEEEIERRRVNVTLLPLQV
jgi:hypothetical protein